MSVLLSYGADKSDQHMIFCSTELQLIPLFCLKQHRRRLFYQQKKHSITLITTVVQATFNFSSSFVLPFFFLPNHIFSTDSIHKKFSYFYQWLFSFSGTVFIYSFPWFLLSYQVLPFML